MPRRLHTLLLLLVIALAGLGARAQEQEGVVERQMREIESKSMVKPLFKGYSHIVDETGDTCIIIYFNDFVVYPAMRFKSKKEQEEYWRLVRDVKKALPYARLIGETLLETYEYMETFPTHKEREQYMKRMEKEIYAQYKPLLRKFSRRQARVLTKLIRRETNQSGYDIVKAFLGGTRAFFYRTFGVIMGVNINANYRPDRDHDDALIERVATRVEQGQL